MKSPVKSPAVKKDAAVHEEEKVQVKNNEAVHLEVQPPVVQPAAAPVVHQNGEAAHLPVPLPVPERQPVAEVAVP